MKINIMNKYTIEDIIELANDKTYKRELEDFDVVVGGWKSWVWRYC
ncbi:MAG: hypothetical protein ACP5RD_07820 [bacterium]